MMTRSYVPVGGLYQNSLRGKSEENEESQERNNTFCVEQILSSILNVNFTRGAKIEVLLCKVDDVFVDLHHVDEKVLVLLKQKLEHSSRSQPSDVPELPERASNWTRKDWSTARATSLQSHTALTDSVIQL